MHFPHNGKSSKHLGIELESNYSKQFTPRVIWKTKHLKEFASLQNLKHLDLRGSLISIKDFEYLLESLPNTDILTTTLRLKKKNYQCLLGLHRIGTSFLLSESDNEKYSYEEKNNLASENIQTQSFRSLKTAFNALNKREGKKVNKGSQVY